MSCNCELSHVNAADLAHIWPEYMVNPDRPARPLDSLCGDRRCVGSTDSSAACATVHAALRCVRSKVGKRVEVGTHSQKLDRSPDYRSATDTLAVRQLRHERLAPV